MTPHLQNLSSSSIYLLLQPQCVLSIAVWLLVPKSELVTTYRLTQWYVLKNQYIDEMGMAFFSRLTEDKEAIEKAIILHIIICHTKTQNLAFSYSE